MLRSLVGSEMCIRDRFMIGEAWINNNPSRLQRYFGANGDAEFDALFDFCLLYTSDAADDLLCVDLGGRRIIKKKKNK